MTCFIWPVPGFPRVTSKFRTEARPGHNGIDIGRSISPPVPIEGAAIVAAADGQVLTAQWNHASWGHWVEIAHGEAVRTRYAHCMEILVGPGQEVKQGQIIAKVGNTGRSYGPHLHFEVLYNGRQVDPLGFVSPYRQAPAASRAAAHGRSLPHLPHGKSCVALDLPEFAEGTACTGNAFSAVPCRDGAAADGRGGVKKKPIGFPFLTMPGRIFEVLARLTGRR